MIHRSSVPHAFFLDICHLSHISKGGKTSCPPFPQPLPTSLSNTHPSSPPSSLPPSLAAHHCWCNVSSAAGARSGEGTCSGRRRWCWWWHGGAGADERVWHAPLVFVSLSLSVSLCVCHFSHLSFFPLDFLSCQGFGRM